MHNDKIKTLAIAATMALTLTLGAAAQAASGDDLCRQYLGNGGRCQMMGSGGRISSESQVIGSGARSDAGQIYGSGNLEDAGVFMGSGGRAGEDASQVLGSGMRSGVIGSGTATGGGAAAEDGGGMIGSGTRSGGGPATEDCGGLIGSGTFVGCRNSGESLSIWDWVRSIFG